MENVTKKSWMKFGLDAEMMARLEGLDGIHGSAVSVWLRAFILLKLHNGSLSKRELLCALVNHSTTRRKVMEVLLATGDFVFDDEASMVMLSEAALTKMTLNSGKNSRDKASTRENFPELEPSNAHAAIEKENREEEGRPTGACTREWPSMPQEMERHWGLTMLQFALHLVTWPSQRGTLTLGDVKCRFSRFLKAGRRPAMELKAKLLMADGQQTGDKAGNFYAWMDKHCRSLLMVERPLDYECFCELSEAYGREAVAQVLLDMENEPGLEMRDCGMMAERWLEARKHR